MTIADIIVAAAIANHVPPALELGVCWTETRHKNRVVLSDGKSPSYGICQIKLATAREVEPNVTSAGLMDARTNARIAAKILRRHLNRYANRPRCAAYAFNHGNAARVCAAAQFPRDKYVENVITAIGSEPWKVPR